MLLSLLYLGYVWQICVTLLRLSSTVQIYGFVKHTALCLSIKREFMPQNLHKHFDVISFK